MEILTKSSNTLIANMYHQVRQTGGYSLIQFIRENQLFKWCFFIWKKRTLYTTKILKEFGRSFLKQISQLQCLTLGLWQIKSTRKQSFWHMDNLFQHLFMTKKSVGNYKNEVIQLTDLFGSRKQLENCIIWGRCWLWRKRQHVMMISRQLRNSNTNLLKKHVLHWAFYRMTRNSLRQQKRLIVEVIECFCTIFLLQC